MLESPFLESIFRDASDLLVVLDRDRTVRLANPAFRALVPQGRRVDGVDFLALVSFHARDRVSRELVRAAAGEDVLLEVPHPVAGDRDQIVEYRFFPLPDARVGGIGRTREAHLALGEQLGRAKAELQQKSRLLDEIQMELTQVPFVDPVTGVWNRLQVIERLTAEWSRSERWGSPVSCLMIEIEGVEVARRLLGEVVADEALKAVARRIKTVVRDHDILGRYGDTRFVVIGVQADGDGTRHLASRIHGCVGSEPIAVAGRTVDLKVRIGGATNRSEGVEILEDLFAVAEGALSDARARSQEFAMAEDADV